MRSVRRSLENTGSCPALCFVKLRTSSSALCAAVVRAGSTDGEPCVVSVSTVDKLSGGIEMASCGVDVGVDVS